MHKRKSYGFDLVEDNHLRHLALSDRVVRLSVQQTYSAFPGKLLLALKIQTACVNALYRSYISEARADRGNLYQLCLINFMIILCYKLLTAWHL